MLYMSCLHVMETMCCMFGNLRSSYILLRMLDPLSFVCAKHVINIFCSMCMCNFTLAVNVAVCLCNVDNCTVQQFLKGRSAVYAFPIFGIWGHLRSAVSCECCYLAICFFSTARG